MQKQKVGDVKMVTCILSKILMLGSAVKVFLKVPGGRVLMALLVLAPFLSVGSIFTSYSQPTSYSQTPARQKSIIRQQSTARGQAPIQTVTKTRKTLPISQKAISQKAISQKAQKGMTRRTPLTGKTPGMVIHKTPQQHTADLANRIKSIMSSSNSDTDKINALRQFIPAPTITVTQEEHVAGVESAKSVEQDLDEMQGQQGEGKEKEGVRMPTAGSTTIYSAEEWPEKLLSIMDANEMFLAVAKVMLQHFKSNGIDSMRYTLTDGGKALVSTPEQWQNITKQLNIFKEKLLKEEKNISQQVVIDQFAYIQALVRLILALSAEVPELTDLIKNMNKKQKKIPTIEDIEEQKKEIRQALSGVKKSEIKQRYYDSHVTSLGQLKQDKHWRELANLARILIDAENYEKIEEDKVSGLVEKSQEYLNEANRSLNTGLFNLLQRKASEAVQWVKGLVWGG